MPEQYDVLFRGTTVIDGSGRAAFRADVGLHGDRIGRIGPIPEDAQAGELVLADGLVIAPGFIDVHAHDDTLVLVEPDSDGKVMQGVTTVINGNCGFGVVPRVEPDGIVRRAEDDIPEWISYGEYLEAFVEQPASINVATLVGQGTLRHGAMRSATETRLAGPDEMARMRTWLRDALELGALGMSTGLVYEPGKYTTADEIADLARECANFDAVYASHIRNEGAQLVESVAEAIDIGRRAGISVQISHHKATGRDNWGAVERSLELIERDRARGSGLTADQYPYVAGSTRLAATIQNSALDSDRGQELAENLVIASAPSAPAMEGRRLSELAAEWELTPLAAAEEVLRRGGLDTLIVSFSMSEDDVRTVLRHESTMIGTDGLGWGSKPHPRAFGTYPRILGYYVRDEGVLELEDAVHKMTFMPARKFNLSNRGRLREGYIADLVLFDPERVIDEATFEDPRRAPAGMPHVYVNGVAVVQDGQHTHARPGRPVRRGVNA